jgi:probable rRNA maturation factor
MQERRAPRTMILLDPDLDPYPVPTRKSVNTASLAIPSSRALARFLSQARSALGLRGDVSVLITTDREIRRLNRQYRGKNKATDVLSFPADPIVKKQEKIDGDIAISVHTASRQAAEQGHALATELRVLILHGLLHLAGFDHEIDDGRMERRERQLRAKLGLPQGLIERATTGTGTGIGIGVGAGRVFSARASRGAGAHSGKGGRR